MARDYKPIARRGGTMEGILPFLLGLALGLAVALMVYFQKRSIAPAAKPVLTQKEAPQQPPVAKPRFDFYTILLEQGVKVPTQDLKLEEEPKQTERENMERGQVLQLGSFRDFQDADQRKANLALLGLSARIERVVLKGGQNRYRVRMGPFPQDVQLEAVRSRLEENQIDFITLRHQ
ncbi:MAG: SPOR domain-containing protein [Gammaproteobacteria bacterium]